MKRKNLKVKLENVNLVKKKSDQDNLEVYNGDKKEEKYKNYLFYIMLNFQIKQILIYAI